MKFFCSDWFFFLFLGRKLSPIQLTKTNLEESDSEKRNKLLELNFQPKRGKSWTQNFELNFPYEITEKWVFSTIYWNIFSLRISKSIRGNWNKKLDLLRIFEANDILDFSKLPVCSLWNFAVKFTQFLRLQNFWKCIIL